MQFIDLKAQQVRIREKIEENIKKVLDHGKYIMGPEVQELEELLADFTKKRYAVGVASGTDALLISLMGYNVGRGDVIITTPFTFIATGEVVQLLGATPVFVDIQPDTFNIDPKQLETMIKQLLDKGEMRPRGIIPVDIFGQTADYDEIEAIAQKYGLFVLQDAAQSFGATYKKQRACAQGNVAATSFFPAKPLGAYGDGGMIFTDDESLHEKVISIRIHGQGVDKYNNIRIGINGRLDTIQAAILLAKMSIFQEEIDLRQEVAARYARGLHSPVIPQVVKEWNISSWAQYSILHPHRDEIILRLKKEGIPTAIYYPTPLHLQEAFSHLGYQTGDFPICEKVASEIFSLPMHPYLTADQQEKIINAING